MTTAPELELYPYVEDGLLELDLIAADLIAAQFVDALQGLVAARDTLRADPSASVVYALDPAPDGRGRILIIGAAARSPESIQASVTALQGVVGIRINRWTATTRRNRKPRIDSGLLGGRSPFLGQFHGWMLLRQ